MKRDPAPNIIYLQWYGCDRMTVINDDNTETPMPFEDYDEPYEVTWEHDRIYDTDVPYQRADLAEAKITRLREARDEAIMLLRTVQYEVVPWSYMSMGVRKRVAHYLARIAKEAER